MEFDFTLAILVGKVRGLTGAVADSTAAFFNHHCLATGEA